MDHIPLGALTGAFLILLSISVFLSAPDSGARPDRSSHDRKPRVREFLRDTGRYLALVATAAAAGVIALRAGELAVFIAVLLLAPLHVAATRLLRRRLAKPALSEGTPQAELTALLERSETTVDDIMVPRREIAGIDLDADWNGIRAQLQNSRHTCLPVYEDTLDNLVGVVHLRDVFVASAREPLDRERLRALVREPYFIPEATPLHRQLAAFREGRQELGLVVDEYGDIRGLLTPRDIIEEIAGDLLAGPVTGIRVTPETDGSYIVSGAIAVRTLNRVLQWELPTGGPKTLNGLILETLETIPSPNTSVRVAGYPMEVVQSTRNAIKVVRLRPRLVDTGAPKTGEFVD